MATRSLRTLLAYTSLVGLPVLGIWLVLRAGEGLDAPADVSGAFETGARARECFGVERLDISQSGRFLDVGTGAGASPGRVEDDRVTATFAAPAGSCEGRTVALDAVVRDGELVGTFSASACAACDSVVLRSAALVEEDE